MSQKITKNLYKIGIARGCVASILGSIAFLIAELIILLINGELVNMETGHILVLVIFMLGSFLASIFPSIIGAIFLSFKIYELMKSNISVGHSILYEGLKTGFLVGVGICILIIVIYLYRSEILVIMIQTAIATLISASIAGLTALKIKRDIQQNGLLN